MFFKVHVLESEVNREWYVERTTNVKKRIKEHNQGLNASTKRYAPWKLIYYEGCLNEKDAKRREKYLKSTQGRRMLKRRLKEYRYEQKHLAS